MIKYHTSFSAFWYQKVLSKYVLFKAIDRNRNLVQLVSVTDFYFVLNPILSTSLKTLG